MIKVKRGFETIVASNNVKYRDRWKPLMITDIEEDLKKGCLKEMPKELRKNISYNLQYLEYITFQINELSLNSALKNSLIKNYIITGSSIIEAIFYYLIKKNNYCTKKDLQIIYSTKANPIKHNNESLVVETNVYKKTDAYEVEMTYDAMIKKIESKKLLSINHNAFPYIKRFKQLRNRVHLQLTESILDTEWWAFSMYDYLLMRYTLYTIINDDNIRGLEAKESALYFLKLDTDELITLSSYFKKKEEKKNNNE